MASQGVRRIDKVWIDYSMDRETKVFERISLTVNGVEVCRAA